MQFFRVRNFERYQHYHDRKPPWIKLYRDLWLDPTFARLSHVSKLCLIGLFTVASETDNRVPFDPKWIRQRLAIPLAIDFKALFDSQFIEPIDCDASALLAPCNTHVSVNAIVETEVQKYRDRSTETEAQKVLAFKCETGFSCNGHHAECTEAFTSFWNAYPRHDPPRKQTRLKWCAQFKAGLEISDLLAWIERAKTRWTEKKYIPQPTTWLNQRRWEGDLPPEPRTLITKDPCSDCIHRLKISCQECDTCEEGSHHEARQ